MTATVSCLIANPAGHNGNLAERKCKSGRTLMQICKDRNSPAPRNSSASRSKAYSPRRCDHFPYTSPSDSYFGHLQGASGAQVIFTKAKLKFSSPGGTAQRPFQGRWLVLMEPNWFQQSRRAATHRSRTAASGTNEFQIRPDSQLQHKYAPPELIGHRKRPLRGALAGLQVDADLQYTAS